MTENRNEKLLNEALRYIVAHIPGEEAYRFLHSQMGISNEELMQYGLNDLREYFQYEWEDGQAAAAARCAYYLCVDLLRQ